MSFIAVILLAVFSGVISGVVGTGSSILLIPALTYVFGAKEAVPIMALASVMGNLSRIYLWRHSIRFKPLFYYLLPGIPAVILGANTLWVMPEKMAQYRDGAVLHSDDPNYSFITPTSN